MKFLIIKKMTITKRKINETIVDMDVKGRLVA